MVATAISIALLLSAALHDVAARTVPNGLALALAATGLAARVIDRNLVPGLMIGLIVFIVAAVCWRRGWMGGGDVKLMGAAAIAVQPADVVTFVVVMSLAGAILALIYLGGRMLPAERPGPRPTALPARAMRAERWRLHRGGPLPYACAIAAGGVFVLI
jgi:prepilin peptidase CpaA